MKKIWLRIPIIKSGIVLICAVAAAITISSCRKTMFYACCNTGHTPWQGDKTEKEQTARMAANDHDIIIHGNVSTAQICSDP